MSGVAIVMHMLSLSHGIAAGLMSVAIFSVAGSLLLPRRWVTSTDGPTPDFVVAALYLVLCALATGSRNIPLIYVMLAFAAVLCVMASVRLRWLQASMRERVFSSSSRDWILAFCSFYVLTYTLLLPPAGDDYLPLAPAGNLDLVTYARYARQLLESGPRNLNLATFDHFRSPASTHFLAWQSMFFGRDPLSAAMPTLIALAALFGTIAVGFTCSVFGLSHRASLAIAFVTISGPLFRSLAATYALSSVLATAVLVYLLGTLCVLVSKRAETGPLIAGFIAGSLVLCFVEPALLSSVNGALRASGRLLRTVSPLALLGWPGRTAQVQVDSARAAALAVLPLVPIAWGSAVYALSRVRFFDRIAKSATDRRLTSALPGYVVLALVIGNVAVDATVDPHPPRVAAAWRNLEDVNRLPFTALTLKMDDEPNSLSTALALYFLWTKTAQVVGSSVAVDEMRFDAISRHEPVLIHNLGCQAAGHDDTASVTGIGCLLFAPPSMTVGRSYPFNRTFLFMTHGGMTAREPGGRWNTGRTLPLKVTGDPARAGLDRDMYVDFFVNPFLPAGVKPQRLVFSWGNGRTGETAVGEQVWISLPVQSDDWTGNRLWTLPVTIDFPDGRTVLFHELSLTEAPRGQIVQSSPKSRL